MDILTHKERAFGKKNPFVRLPGQSLKSKQHLTIHWMNIIEPFHYSLNSTISLLPLNFWLQRKIEIIHITLTLEQTNILLDACARALYAAYKKGFGMVLTKCTVITTPLWKHELCHWALLLPTTGTKTKVYMRFFNISFFLMVLKAKWDPENIFSRIKNQSLILKAF